MHHRRPEEPYPAVASASVQEEVAQLPVFASCSGVELLRREEQVESVGTWLGQAEVPDVQELLPQQQEEQEEVPDETQHHPREGVGCCLEKVA